MVPAVLKTSRESFMIWDLTQPSGDVWGDQVVLRINPKSGPRMAYISSISVISL